MKLPYSRKWRPILGNTIFSLLVPFGQKSNLQIFSDLPIKIGSTEDHLATPFLQFHFFGTLTVSNEELSLVHSQRNENHILKYILLPTSINKILAPF